MWKNQLFYCYNIFSCFPSDWILYGLYDSYALQILQLVKRSLYIFVKSPISLPRPHFEPDLAPLFPRLGNQAQSGPWTGLERVLNGLTHVWDCLR